MGQIGSRSEGNGRRCHFARLAAVEVQLVMQMLDRQSKCRVARCSRLLLPQLSQRLSWEAWDNDQPVTLEMRPSLPLLSSDDWNGGAMGIGAVPRVCDKGYMSSPLPQRQWIPLALHVTGLTSLDLNELARCPSFHAFSADASNNFRDVTRVLLTADNMRHLRDLRLELLAVSADAWLVQHVCSLQRLHTLHLFVRSHGRGEQIEAIRRPQRSQLRALGEHLPNLTELQCDVASWKLSLAHSPLATRLLRLGLPAVDLCAVLEDMDLVTFTSLLALEAAVRLEHLLLFGRFWKDVGNAGQMSVPSRVRQIDTPEEYVRPENQPPPLRNLHTLTLAGFPDPTAFLDVFAVSASSSQMQQQQHPSAIQLRVLRFSFRKYFFDISYEKIAVGAHIAAAKEALRRCGPDLRVEVEGVDRLSDKHFSQWTQLASSRLLLVD
jgi:hypothetical protein